MNATELTPELSALVTAARSLPPELVRRVTNYVEDLAKRAALPVDESDEWTEEDMRDLAAACAREFDRRHPDD